MRARPLLIPGVFTLIALAILIGLGTWQLQRLHWKEALVARITQRVAEPPVALPPRGEWAGLDFGTWEYRPVELTGRYRHDLETRVYALLAEPHGRLSGPGYWIMTPFALDGERGDVVINRGFVPLDRADPATRPDAETEGSVTVRGLLRAPEARNPFTPDDQPDKKLFYARDPAPIAAALGLSQAAPFTVDATETPASGLPQAGETRLEFPNRHLEYALTWYGLAAALLGVFVAFSIARLRRR